MKWTSFPAVVLVVAVSTTAHADLMSRLKRVVSDTMPFNSPTLAVPQEDYANQIEQAQIQLQPVANSRTAAESTIHLSGHKGGNCGCDALKCRGSWWKKLTGCGKSGCGKSGCGAWPACRSAIWDFRLRESDLGLFDLPLFSSFRSGGKCGAGGNCGRKRRCGGKGCGWFNMARGKSDCGCGHGPVETWSESKSEDTIVQPPPPMPETEPESEERSAQWWQLPRVRKVLGTL